VDDLPRFGYITKLGGGKKGKKKNPGSQVTYKTPINAPKGQEYIYI
jgi:hypothetical protein